MPPARRRLAPWLAAGALALAAALSSCSTLPAVPAAAGARAAGDVPALDATGGGLAAVLAPDATALSAPPAPAAPVATAAPAPQGPAAFGDVPASYWAHAPITALATAGVLEGVAPGRFDPDGPVTRAQFAALLARIGQVPAGTAGPAFADVPAGAWFFSGVEAAAGRGWLGGTAPGTFSPDADLTRAQAAAAATAYLGMGHVADDEARGTCPFADCAALPAWARGPALVADHLGIMAGDPSGAFRPGAGLTRAEAAAVLWRLQAVGAPALATEGARVATVLHVDASSPALEPGGRATLSAYAHDAVGYIIPAAVSWSISGPGRITATSGRQATITATGPGTITATARIPSRGLTTAATLSALARAAATVSGLPPAGLAHAHFSVAVAVRAAGGGPDPAAAGTVSLTATANGTVAGSSSAPLAGGTAQVPLPDLPTGTYTLTLRVAGVPPLQLPYRAVPAPLGAIDLQGPTGPILAGWPVAITASASGGPWPVHLSVTGSPAGPAPLVGEAARPAVLSLESSSMTLTSAGLLPHLGAAAPGTATITATVPGGALTAGTLELRVQPVGAFGAASAPTVRAGQTATVSVALASLPGTPLQATSGTAVWLQPVTPAGHPLPGLQATVSGGRATAHFVPTLAGNWHLLWSASGFVPAQAGTLMVQPGPAAALSVTVSPTTVLVAGEQATVRAALTDRYGNALPTRLHVTATKSGGTAVAYQAVAPSAAGPGIIGQFTAEAPGTASWVFASPDHGSLQPVHLSLRTVAAAADRIAGKGLWLTFPDWKNTSDADILAAAKAYGATHIYLEVATSGDGFYGGRGLDDLLPKAHAAGIAVLAWIFPDLGDPAADQTILAQVAAYRTPDGEAADGLALDIEDNLDPPTVAAYAKAARAVAAPDVPVVGITWAPQQKPDYPYAALGPYVDAIAPMDYWHVIEADYDYAGVYAWVAASVRQIRRASGRPDMPIDVIAETFDWFSNSGQGIFSPTADELAAAIAGAGDAGANGISFYRPGTATAAERAVATAAAWPAGG